jgi:receptor expression-enhancing protein 5/6
MYWVVFSVFSVLEFFSDILVGWVPFYWLGKVCFFFPEAGS